MKKGRSHKVITNVDLVNNYMEFGSPLNQAFLIQAVTTFANVVIREKEKLIAKDKKKPLVINPHAWVKCAEDWLDQQQKRDDHNANLFFAGMSPVDLVEGKEYTWFMGAEPMRCKYDKRGEKPATYVFELFDKNSGSNGILHTLSAQDVKDYIEPFQTYLDFIKENM